MVGRSLAGRLEELRREGAVAAEAGRGSEARDFLIALCEEVVRLGEVVERYERRLDKIRIVTPSGRERI